MEGGVNLSGVKVREFSPQIDGERCMRAQAISMYPPFLRRY